MDELDMKPIQPDANPSNFFWGNIFIVLLALQGALMCVFGSRTLSNGFVGLGILRIIIGFTHFLAAWGLWKRSYYGLSLSYIVIGYSVLRDVLSILHDLNHVGGRLIAICLTVPFLFYLRRRTGLFIKRS